MAARFTVLASGSSGNASLVELDGFGLLVDCGLGPRALASRLAAIGLSWQAVSAVVVTHTHGDHWNALTLGHLRRLNIPLIAHPRHHDFLASRDEHSALCKAGLLREYAADTWFDLTPALGCRPVRVPHDSEPTFAFRVEAREDGGGWALGLASDVGCVTPELAAAFDGVDALAVEFNHDVQMQKQSGRPRLLIDRVLGDEGHLSNVQAADFTRHVVQAAGRDRLAFLVQLHLSRDCNRPELAGKAGKAALAEAPSAKLVTATQFHPTAPLPLVARPRPARHVPRPYPPTKRTFQPTLPGLDPAR
jgi:hypothetical protein